MNLIYDVVVIGAGHAGCEAASASARMGSKTVLVTHSIQTIGKMSCNPAVGGIGKGIVVKEIDALGGLMPLVTDKSSIHSKMLNSSKGHAVRGPRAQVDINLYSLNMQNLILGHKNLTVIESEVSELLIDNSTKFGKKILGILTTTGVSVIAKSVVLTSGTFLNGVIKIGNKKIHSGRDGEQSSKKLAKSISSLGLQMARLRTGTPPRILKSSIDFSGLELQSGDNPPEPFSYMTKAIMQAQVNCSITRTNPTTHNIILENLEKYMETNNDNTIVPPRYCPSIETKVMRYPDRKSHQIFLEPQELEGELIYPNGISMSLPEELQDRVVHSIKGLQEASIQKYGYTIEYDYVNPTELKNTLETKNISSLFFAGQINGTTGYEEAAGQGIVAGVNASLKSQMDNRSFTMGRHESFIGVMIDDLTKKGVTEPYRLFTSRAEYRLKLRYDNADRRLTDKYGREFGLICEERLKILKQKESSIQFYWDKMKKTEISPSRLNNVFGIMVSQDGVTKSAIDLLSYHSVDFSKIREIWPDLTQDIPAHISDIIAVEAKYMPYMTKQQSEIDLCKNHQYLNIPHSIDYSSISGISNEALETLEKARPKTIGEASCLSGINPVTITRLVVHLVYERKHAE